MGEFPDEIGTFFGFCLIKGLETPSARGVFGVCLFWDGKNLYTLLYLQVPRNA